MKLQSFTPLKNSYQNCEDLLKIQKDSYRVNVHGARTTIMLALFGAVLIDCCIELSVLGLIWQNMTKLCSFGW